MQKLFPPLPRNIYNSLEELPKALQATFPLQAKHHRQLPFAVEELSTRLTSERGLAHQPYWSAPRLTAAYLWYFLPWNIIRLTRLFHGLDIPAPTPLPCSNKEGAQVKPRIFVDMGSGPLSVPIALWLAKPAWRDTPLTILCTDASPHPLQLGQKLFYELAGKDSPWRITTVKAQLEGTAHEIQKLSGIPWLITAANVCNELKPRQGQSLDERLHALLERLAPLVKAPDASLLFIEPGTRLGGKTIVSLREAAQSCFLQAISPCPHNHDCPLEDSRTWCHFTFDTSASPTWLNNLSNAAKLRKEALSLAFVLLQNGSDASTANTNEARIISAPFKVPHIHGLARYACAAQGLALLSNADTLISGSLVPLKASSAKPRVDAKSGAFILEHDVIVEKNLHTPYNSQQHSRDQGKYSIPKKPHSKETKDAFFPKAKEGTPPEVKKKKAPAKTKKDNKKFWEK